MKVLFLNHNYENFGTYWRCYYLAKYLSLKGISVDLVCASRKKFDLGIRIHRGNGNFRVITLPRFRFHEYHTGHNLRGLINSELVMIKDYDILHVFAVSQPATAFPTVIAGMFKSQPIIVDWDDLWGGGFGLYHPNLVHRLLYLNERYIPRFAKKITVVSDFLMKRAIDYGYNGGKIEKIPNAANVDEIKPMDKNYAKKYLNIPIDDKIILSIGHTYMGNIDIFMDVVNETIKKSSKVKFYLIGNIGSASKGIKKCKNLVVTGEQPFSEIPYYLASADILILIMGQSDIEKARWPIRFGDYLSSGRPIVSNAVGEVKRILEDEDCGAVVKPDNIAEFSNTILNLMDDNKKQEELGQKARRIAEEKYSWGQVTEKLINLYKGVI